MEIDQGISSSAKQGDSAVKDKGDWRGFRSEYKNTGRMGSRIKICRAPSGKKFTGWGWSP